MRFAYMSNNKVISDPIPKSRVAWALAEAKKMFTGTFDVWYDRPMKHYHIKISGAKPRAGYSGRKPPAILKKDGVTKMFTAR